VVPEHLPLESGRGRARTELALLENAIALGNTEGLPVQAITRVARSVAQGVLETATEEAADLIVLGWGGGPVRPGRGSLGSVADPVLRDASCDVLIVRGDVPEPLQRILVPTAGGPHARAAAQTAALLSDACDAELTLLYVQPGPAAPGQMEQNRQTLATAVEGLNAERPPELKVVSAPNIADGILQEAEQHDLLLIGTSDESLLDRLVFGSVPLQVMMQARTAGLVQAGRGLTGRWSRRLARALQGMLPPLSPEDQLELRRDSYRGARPGINYFVLIVLSCIIAALGLLLNSPAVVIGAMLVAPLMSPILAFSLGLVLGDLRLIRLAAEAIFKGVSIALMIAVLIGLVTPPQSITPEMLARTRPTLLDLAVALASGMAGAYALARKDVSAALPGVAIAAALMPPLATVGLSLAMGDLRASGGSLLLFAANIAAISLAGGVVFLLLGIRPRAWGPEPRRQLRLRLVASLILLLAIAVPLGIIMQASARDAALEQRARTFLADEFEDPNHVVSLEASEGEHGLAVVATVHSSESPDQSEVNSMAEALSQHLGHPVQLEIIVLPAIRSGQ
jgi:uncharacterized hydrophobic protein (TIGR00271 family)